MGKRFDFPFNEDDSEKDFENRKKKDVSIEDQIMLAQQEQTSILKADVDEKILQDAISVASHDWIWNFRSAKSKLVIIKKVYNSLKKIVDEMF